MAVEGLWTVDKKIEHGRFEQVDVELVAAYNDGVGNEDWSKYTPSGEIKMSITNPPASDYFKPGEIYKLVFTKVRP